MNQNQMPEMIPINQIVANPHRDLDLFPLDPEHVDDLVKSIGEHGFFASLKGRRRTDNKVELGFGHARWSAARKSGLTAIPIYIDDISDDTMVSLMTVENSTQSGSNPGAVMNEVAAVTRRIINSLSKEFDSRTPSIKWAFEDKAAFETARTKMRKRMTNPNLEVPVGYHVVLRYLGQGDEKKSQRGRTQVVEAITALKQSGRYDKIVDEAISLYAEPVPDTPPSKSKEVKKTTSSTRKRILDERTANLFPNEHQFAAFREAVTTSAAQKYIPVESQYALAKEITDPKHRLEFRKKHTGAPFIKTMVHAKVEEASRQQRAIDKEERDRLFMEQAEAEIDAAMLSANSSLRSLISAIAKLDELAGKYPMNPKIGAFSMKLDRLVNDIQRLAKRFNPKKP